MHPMGALVLMGGGGSKKIVGWGGGFSPLWETLQGDTIITADYDQAFSKYSK